MRSQSLWWSMADDLDPKIKTWRGLIQNQFVPVLSVGHFDGRLDLRNMNLPNPTVEVTTQTLNGRLDYLSGTTEIRQGKWQGIDFSFSRMPALRLFDVQVENCLFDKCRLPDLRMWGTRFSDVSFRGADLRGASLGALYEGRRIRYTDVDFTGADLRGAHAHAAEFKDCVFDDARLDKVEFGGSSFVDCRFVGDVREVIFYRRPFGAPTLSENKMERVDFSRARLRWCAFRELDLDTVIFPDDDEHIVLRNYPVVVAKLLDQLRTQPEAGWRHFSAVLRDHLKWMGPAQKRGRAQQS
jgi:uncharacterized protein YjbI with pentapeptide repeats